VSWFAYVYAGHPDRLRQQLSRAVNDIFSDRDQGAVGLCVDGDLHSSLASPPASSFWNHPLVGSNGSAVGTVGDKASSDLGWHRQTRRILGA
jgi:hypothetical protein